MPMSTLLQHSLAIALSDAYCSPRISSVLACSRIRSNREPQSNPGMMSTQSLRKDSTAQGSATCARPPRANMASRKRMSPPHAPDANPSVARAASNSAAIRFAICGASDVGKRGVLRPGRSTMCPVNAIVEVIRA